jgi:hypothetical protein
VLSSNAPKCTKAARTAQAPRTAREARIFRKAVVTAGILPSAVTDCDDRAQEPPVWAMTFPRLDHPCPPGRGRFGRMMGAMPRPRGMFRCWLTRQGRWELAHLPRSQWRPKRPGQRLYRCAICDAYRVSP